MNPQFRTTVIDFLSNTPEARQVISHIKYDAAQQSGRIEYNREAVWIDPRAPGFAAGSTVITDEELVRAYLTVRLVTIYNYPAKPGILEFERVYKSVGRPGKGGRIDVVVRYRGMPNAFLFIECKEPEHYDSDLKLIDGQLFRLSRQERKLPKHLLYFTVELRDGALRERALLVDTATYPDFESWDKAGQPITDSIPSGYGLARKRAYANVDSPTAHARPLEYGTNTEEFSRIRNEIHDVIWGGGGTNNNDVFVYITKLILCKIYDEQETEPAKEYEFQRFGDASAPESPQEVMSRMNDLYSRAEAAYLALPTQSTGPAFDPVKISQQKIAYVVGRLEGISVTNNTHGGDLLGEFFEQIVSQDFTQSKGQFFTPLKIVRFMLSLIDAADNAALVLRNKKDHLGRPRLPFVIDPACGSGTFLIEYMKEISARLSNDALRRGLPTRVREMHALWFGGRRNNTWAKDFLFGIENNYDLGLAAKVNMVLHGDGSMNTWISSGLLPFDAYWVDGRHNILGTLSASPNHGYGSPLNEQFDLVISNPPFSITMSPDERRLVQRAFGDSLQISEQIFIERWYQLLREGGKFCCVLPEAILDTGSNKSSRLFLLKHFELLAVVSLPYDAFKPFTSTKTCVVYARKRPHESSRRWDRLWDKRSAFKDPAERLVATLADLGYLEDEIFMAEPAEIGYKRRKNLPDLVRPNQLYREGPDSAVACINSKEPTTVLDNFFSVESLDDPSLGFRVKLADIVARPGIRLDPKYAWLWIKQRGLVLGDGDKAHELRQHLELVELEKIKKGGLAEERQLIDLEQVQGRTGTMIATPPVVAEIGSDKVAFDGAEFLFSKLEPYLGKLLINPPSDGIGSTEWVGFRRKTHVPTLYLAHLLMHPKRCEAYRRLQAGKRHARLDPLEMLLLRVEVKEGDAAELLESFIRAQRATIKARLSEVQSLRLEVDRRLG